MLPSEFADAGYCHCVVLRKLSSREALSVEKCMPSRLDVCPRWFYYSEEYQEQTLFTLLDNVLIEWTIKPRRDNPRDVNGSRIYQLMLQHMQLLPCAKYTQPVFVETLKAGKGKRKAADEAAGQSPTKKDSFTAAAVEEDELEYTMIE